MLQRFAVVLSAAVITVACGQTDAGITTAVKSKLAADDTVKAYEINVTTENKVVTLEGSVETPAAKEQALTLARNTDGVREVVDRLSVGESAATTGVRDAPGAGTDIDEKAEAQAREGQAKAKDAAREGKARAGDAADKAADATRDAAITSAVKTKLLADTAVGGLKIDVDTSGGVVTLNGNVASQAEADRAIQLAKGTEGVREVVNNLHVGR